MRSFRAEIVRAMSRGTLLLLVLALAFSVLGMANAGHQHHTPLWGYRQAAIFVATLLMGRAATVAASDYGTATIRPWLISAPNRRSVAFGKAAAAVAVSLVFVVIGGVVAYVVSCALGTMPAGYELAESVGGLALATVGMSLFGHAIGVLTRSVPAALALTLAWILPAEHVLDGPIKHANRILPGLVNQDITLWALPAGLSWGSAIARAILPFLVLEVVAVIWFIRKNVTA